MAPICVRQDVALKLHLGLTQSQDVALELHLGLTQSQDVALELHLGLPQSQDVALELHLGLTQSQDVALELHLGLTESRRSARVTLRSHTESRRSARSPDVALELHFGLTQSQDVALELHLGLTQSQDVALELHLGLTESRHKPKPMFSIDNINSRQGGGPSPPGGESGCHVFRSKGLCSAWGLAHLARAVGLDPCSEQATVHQRRCVAVALFYTKVYNSPMASLVLADSSKLTSDSQHLVFISCSKRCTRIAGQLIRVEYGG
uniref:Uncharacterized protein n=1 Tax=Timema shepardi TaxID=629360 RepID=A0A7R9G777_TIMSH|nr:unnamed protein product [Timema shepardi]